jgi:hypothetical protein
LTGTVTGRPKVYILVLRKEEREGVSYGNSLWEVMWCRGKESRKLLPYRKYVAVEGRKAVNCFPIGSMLLQREGKP